MDQSDIVVSFTLSADEARRQTADLQNAASPTKASIRMQFAVGAMWLTLGIFDLITHQTKWIGWFNIFLGAVYFMSVLQMRSRLVNVPAGVETSIRFDPAKIVVERPAPQTLPWSAVESVDRYDGAFVVRFLASEIKPPLERRVVIPKQALTEGGIAFWHLSEQMLLGPLRRVSAQMSVDETGALRRTDTMHIDNVRARVAKLNPRGISTQTASLRS